MLRYLVDSESALLNGEAVPGAFAVDEKGGVVRRYVLDTKGERVMEGERSAVETLKGKVAVVKANEAKNAKIVKQQTTETPKEEQSPRSEQ